MKLVDLIFGRDHCLQPEPLRMRAGTMVDLPDILEIERSQFDYQWCDIDFRAFVHERYTHLKVAMLGDELAGYYCARVMPKCVFIENIAVARHHQRRGVGSAMLDDIKRMLSQYRRPRVVTVVRESNLGAQQFFRANDFWCECGVRRYFLDSNGEDGLRFQFGAEKRFIGWEE